MEVIKKGDYKLRDWFMEVECNGLGYWNKRKPCHSILKLEDGDILYLDCIEHHGPGVTQYYHQYGFICCECNCFTEVSTEQIPQEVLEYATKIATKCSQEYKDLTDEGKAWSEYL